MLSLVMTCPNGTVPTFNNEGIYREITYIGKTVIQHYTAMRLYTAFSIDVRFNSYNVYLH